MVKHIVMLGHERFYFQYLDQRTHTSLKTAFNSTTPLSLFRYVFARDGTLQLFCC